MYHTLATFLQLLRRDVYVTLKRADVFLINFGIIYPVMYAFGWLYLQPHVLFAHNQNEHGSITFIGMILLFALIVSFEMTIHLLFDLTSDRFIDYQCSLINARLVIIERIIFASLFTFVLLLPFFPVAKLLFPGSFLIPNASWISLSWILFLTACMTSAFHLMAACIMDNAHQISKLWLRYDEVMLILGGMFIPWSIMYQTSPTLGYITLLNPMLYATEGARQALLQSPQFFPIWACSLAMIIFTVACTIVACIVFKKRVDHI